MVVEYFLAYDSELKMYLVQEGDEYGNVVTHSSYHQMKIARNTVIQLNERLLDGIAVAANGQASVV